MHKVLKAFYAVSFSCDLPSLHRRCTNSHQHKLCDACLLLLQLNAGKQKHAASLNEVISVNIVLCVACK